MVGPRDEEGSNLKSPKSPLTQYESIAAQYSRLKWLPIYDLVQEILFENIGDISGCSLIDLGCGSGFYTRRLKTAGVAHTVGIDVSRAMIDLAQAAEASNPLGIEYYCYDVADLPLIGQFDVATAIYLLNHASSRGKLLSICAAVARNLREGGRFLAVNAHVDPSSKLPPPPMPGYGVVSYKVAGWPPWDGMPTEIVLGDSTTRVTIKNWYYSKALYEATLRAAGFSAVSWRLISTPRNLVDDVEREQLRDSGLVTLIECERR